MDGWMGRLYHTARTVYDVSPLRLVGVRVQEVEFVIRVHDIVPHSTADGADDDAGVASDHDAGDDCDYDAADGVDYDDAADGVDYDDAGVDKDDAAGGDDDVDADSGGDDAGVDVKC